MSSHVCVTGHINVTENRTALDFDFVCPYSTKKRRGSRYTDKVPDKSSCKYSLRDLLHNFAY